MRSRRQIFCAAAFVIIAAAAAAVGVVVARSTNHGQRRIAAPGGRSAPSGGRTNRGDRRASAAVALVNGTPIDDEALAVRLQELLPLASYHGNVEPGRLLALRRAALDDLVFDELIYREAVADGRSAPAGAVDAQLADVKARFDDLEQYAAALAESGLTEAAFRERLARTVIVREARAEHARQTITEADISAYYEANQRMFERPERVHLLEILVRRDPSDPASRTAAEKKARNLLAQLHRGAAFDRLARTASEDEYRVKDGDMGFVHRGRLDATFEAAVFAAAPGRFEIAESLYGFQVFKVVERRGAEQLSLREARPIIAERLERLRREEALRAWHAKLIAGARIDIRDGALRGARPAEVASPWTTGPGGRMRPVRVAGVRP
ncbi:MAG: peptidylprolyl isomerase [Bacteroidales bacterium]